MTDDGKRLVLARLVAFRETPPREWDEEAVLEYHAIIQDLELAHRVPLAQFKIPDDRLKPRLLSIQRAGRSGRPGRSVYSQNLYCDHSFAQRQLAGLWTYFEQIGTTDDTQYATEASSASNREMNPDSEPIRSPQAIIIRLPPPEAPLDSPPPRIILRLELREKRYTLVGGPADPNAREELYSEFRLLAQEAEAFVTQYSSLKQSSVDDWLDRLKYEAEPNHSHEGPIEHLLTLSARHLKALRVHEMRLILHQLTGGIPVRDPQNFERLATKFVELRTQFFGSSPGVENFSAVTTPSSGVDASAASEVESHTFTAALPRKRGRPPKIDNATKDAALAAKARGGTARDVAKILYKTPYPSRQQVKNAPNILKHYQKAMGPNKS